jgi:dTDP-4-amino-4,6-dideoxygalactose transaminase
VSNPIPFFDLMGEIGPLADDLEQAASRVLRSGAFILGPEVSAFESEAAKLLNVGHAIGVNSGTDALVIALRALEIGPGDEVITSPFTFIASAEAIDLVGATTVFADVNPDTFCMDAAAVEAAVTPKTKAIVPVHLFGHSADMDALHQVAEQHGLKVLEDAAQVIGGTYNGRTCGSMGHLAAFSFYPTKNLGACGDGGMITTNDDDLADRVKMLRGHGSKGREQHVMVGYNSRLDSLQAAFLRVKLPHLSKFNDGRRAVAARYDAALASVDGIETPFIAGGIHHVYHQYTVRILNGKRDAVREALATDGIGSMVYYLNPLHTLPVYKAGGGSFPVSERLATEVLSLPVYPHLPEVDQQRVIDGIKKALA